MRKPFLDNLRYGIVLSVVAYHVFYQFNSVGVITNVVIPGIPALDAPLYVLYPWFMAALFMISGICARYSLEKQTGKQYLKGKVRRQLIPSIAIIFLIGCFFRGFLFCRFFLFLFRFSLRHLFHCNQNAVHKAKL